MIGNTVGLVRKRPRDLGRRGTIVRVGTPGGSADEQARKLTDEAARWAAGAEGERRVAAALSSLPAGWTVVHDRLLRPGRSQANLDHVVVGMTGIYLVDAKNRAGRVTEHDGGLFQHRHRNGRVESVSLAAELTKVHGMAAYMAAETDRPVTPVLCLAGGHADDFGEPRMVRGVWVVPVAALPGWLRGRPVTIPAEAVPSVATRVITDFPSTTTDPALLSAMAGAAAPRAGRRRRGRPSGAAAQPVTGGHVPTTTRASGSSRASAPTVVPLRRPRRIRRRLAKVVMVGSLVTGGLLVLSHLPSIIESVVEDLTRAAVPGGAPSVQPPATAALITKAAQASKKTSGGAPKSTAKKTGALKPVPVRPLGPPDCANASAAEIKAIIHRTVQPVVTSRGCAWGTRLDDPSTLLVTIVMTADHDSWDRNLTTSVNQKRVVFSGSLDSTYRPATQASVATGQPIIRGARPVSARADTVVVVATTKLGISDDRAREMAVKIAAAANG